jgi:hypothetical protein
MAGFHVVQTVPLLFLDLSKQVFVYASFFGDLGLHASDFLFDEFVCVSFLFEEQDCFFENRHLFIVVILAGNFGLSHLGG